MSNCSLQRDHLGALHLLVDGVPAFGATVHSITGDTGKLSAIVSIPLAQCTIGELSKVIPFVLPKAA